jgi:hypothetical protein
VPVDVALAKTNTPTSLVLRLEAVLPEMGCDAAGGVSSRQHPSFLNFRALSSDELLSAMIEDHRRLVDGGLGIGRLA